MAAAQAAYSGRLSQHPELGRPLLAGSSNSGFLQDGLNCINYVRYLAGLPDDVILDRPRDKAQHGAVLLRAGRSRTPSPSPPTWTRPSTTSPTPRRVRATSGGATLPCGSSTQLHERRRYRQHRPCRPPAVAPVSPMKKTGWASPTRARTPTCSTGAERARRLRLGKWPSAGVFPVEMFPADVPWSVTLNPSLYTWTAGTAGHTVTLTRRRDNKTWTFDSADTNKSGEYFNFETNGYGVANCFIFRPDPASVGSYSSRRRLRRDHLRRVHEQDRRHPATIAYTTPVRFAGVPAGPGSLSGLVTRAAAPRRRDRPHRLVVACHDRYRRAVHISGITPGTYAVGFDKAGYVAQSATVGIRSGRRRRGTPRSPRSPRLRY